MTVILKFELGDHPIMLADTLLTVESNVDEEISTPLREGINTSLLRGRRFHVSMTRNKVHTFGNDAIIVWAGDYTACYKLIKMLNSYNCENINQMALEKCLEQLSPDERGAISVILMYRNKDDICVYHYKCQQIRVNTIRNTITCDGPLSGTMMQIINNLQRNLSISHSGCAHLHFTAALIFSSESFGIELSTGSNVLDCWGGGIQIATLSSTSAVTVTNILYIFWTAIDRGDYFELKQRNIIIKQECADNTIRTRVIKIDFENQKELDGSLHVMMGIIPNELAANNISLPGLGYEWICTNITINRQDGSKDYITFADAPKWGPGYYILSEEGDKLHQFINHGYIKSIERLVLARTCKETKVILWGNNIVMQ